MIAPDLIGHGYSPGVPPWSIENQVAALARVLERYSSGPAVVVGHSYGGCLAVHLVRAVPERVSALVLLDPAMALDPELAARFAESTVYDGDYTDADEAYHDKLDAGWRNLPDGVLETELAEHLIDYPRGRVGWRMSIPAVVTTWSELARPVVLPPAGIPVTVVRAERVQPPFLPAAYVDDLAAAGARILDWDCDHMVPQECEEESAALAADVLGRAGNRAGAKARSDLAG